MNKGYLFEFVCYDTDNLVTQAVSGRQQGGVAATTQVLILPHLPQWPNNSPGAHFNHPHHQCHLHIRLVETGDKPLDISLSLSTASLFSILATALGVCGLAYVGLGVLGSQ